MQKKLIALAIAGLSGAAFAQSNVTIYGQVNMAYQNASGTYQGTGGAYNVGSANANAVASLANADSRLGFKGEEALGNGMKALFTLEYGINPDQASANTTSNAATGGTVTGTTAAHTNGISGLGASARQTFLGVSTNFGTISVGRQYTPFFEAAAAIDPFGAATGNVSSAARLHPITAIARADNSIKYVGNFSGVIVAGMIGLNERNRGTAAADTTNNTGSLTNIKIAYANGPLLVGYTQIRLGDNAAGTVSGGGSSVLGVGAAATKATAWGGTYDLKVVKLHLLNDRVKVTANGGTAADRNDWLFGATIPMGASTIKVSYNKVDERSNNAATTGDITSNDASQWGLGYSYAMSKRTSLFANYSKISNKGNASFGVNATTSGSGTLGAAAAAERTTGLQLGMAHSF